jgi:hypothetical protein
MCSLYDNQYEAVQLMMSRDINKHSECEIVFSDEFYVRKKKKITVDELFKSMQIDMIKLKGYTSDEAINVEMLAPKKYKYASPKKTSRYLSSR